MIDETPVIFHSHGVPLSGRFLRNTRSLQDQQPAVIVMGSGLTVKEQMAMTYGWKLAEAGYTAFIFDFAGFGRHSCGSRGRGPPESACGRADRGNVGPASSRQVRLGLGYDHPQGTALSWHQALEARLGAPKFSRRRDAVECTPATGLRPSSYAFAFWTITPRSIPDGESRFGSRRSRRNRMHTARTIGARAPCRVARSPLRAGRTCTERSRPPRLPRGRHCAQNRIVRRNQTEARSQTLEQAAELV